MAHRQAWSCRVSAHSCSTHVDGNEGRPRAADRSLKGSVDRAAVVNRIEAQHEQCDVLRVASELQRHEYHRS